MDDASAGQGASLGRRAASAAPGPAAPAPAPLPAASGQARARRIDRLTGLLLLAAAAAVLVPASPVVLHAAGVGVTRPPMQSAGKIGRVLRGAPAAAPRWGHERADDDVPRLRLPDVEEHDGEPPDAPARLRIGVASRALTLLDEPGQDGARVGAIAAGEVVMIVRESGGWALIAQNTDEGVVMGWARRSEIAVR